MDITTAGIESVSVDIISDCCNLKGELTTPAEARGLVLFSLGGGSSHLNPRNNALAAILQQNGFATLNFDLLTEAEEQEDINRGNYRYDIPLLVRRLSGAADWARRYEAVKDLPFGYLGVGTGAAAALVSSTEKAYIAAIVCRGARTDLVDEYLSAVDTPTLLITGSTDTILTDINRRALEQIHGVRQLDIVAGAAQRFEAPATLEELGKLASEWFGRYFEEERRKK